MIAILEYRSLDVYFLQRWQSCRLVIYKTTIKTGDGAVIDCSNAKFANANEREIMVRQIVADGRL